MIAFRPNADMTRHTLSKRLSDLTTGAPRISAGGPLVALGADVDP